MCGITCAFDLKEDSSVLRPQLLEMSKKLRHRGPDWKYFSSDKAALTVSSMPSISSSSEIAIKWDKSFKNINDPSGIAVTEVHKK